MSTTREHTIWCDGKKCGRWAQTAGRVRELKADLQHDGWMFFTKRAGFPQGHALCPACATKWVEKGKRR